MSWNRTWLAVARLFAGIAALCVPFVGAAAREAASAPYQWQNVTVGGGGFAPNVVFSRAEPNLAYLRTDMGGAYRWDAHQQRWIPLQDGNSVSSYMGIESIAADPNKPDVVYLAAGMGRWGQASIWRSEDRGTSWTVFEVPFKMGGNESGRGLGERLAIDPRNLSTLLFGSRHDGLQRSDDSGRTWRKVRGFPYAGLGLPANPRESNGGISFVLFDSQSPAIYAAVADPAERHLYRSSDGGKSWTAVPGGPGSEMLPVKGEIDDAGNLYVAYATSIGPNDIEDGSVWRLDTGTGEWSDITPDPSSQGGYMGLSLDHQRPGRLAVSSINRWQPGDTVWLSEDYGHTWADLSPRSRRDTSVSPFLNWGKKETEFGHWTAGLAIDPFASGTIAYTTGDTVYRTDEGDKQEGTMLWSPWVRGIEQTAVITLISPTGGAPLISGFGDLAGFVHDRLDVSPPGMHLHPTLTNTNNLDYAGLAPNVIVRSGTRRTQRADEGDASLAWSDDGGHIWQPLQVPIAVRGEPARRYDLNGEAPVDVSADGAVFIVSTPVALVTRDRGGTWEAAIGLPVGARVIADKADPALFYAVDYAGSRFYVSRDGAKTFAPADANGLPATLVHVGRTDREAQSPLVAAPGSAGDIWLLSDHRLYRSQNAGDTFQIASDGNLRVELFGLGKSAPGSSDPAVYAIGTKGKLPEVWRSDDGGESWLRINDDAHRWGLRFRAISGDPRRYGRVYIATDGRGLFYGDPATGGQK